MWSFTQACLFEYLGRTSPTAAIEEPDPKWRNAKCDTQALWSHVYHKRDVFVTRDANFLKKTKLPGLAALGAGQILVPRDAAVLLRPAAYKRLKLPGGDRFKG